MSFPRVPTYQQDGVHGKLPTIFARNEAVDGDAEPWISSPLGSLFVRTDAGNVTFYIKTAANDADADWVTFSVSTHTHA